MPVPPPNATVALEDALMSTVEPSVTVTVVGAGEGELSSVGLLGELPDVPVFGGSVISVPPLPSEAKSSVPLKLSKVRLALFVPSDTVSRPVDGL